MQGSKGPTGNLLNSTSASPLSTMLATRKLNTSGQVNRPPHLISYEFENPYTPVCRVRFRQLSVRDEVSEMFASIGEQKIGNGLAKHLLALIKKDPESRSAVFTSLNEHIDSFAEKKFACNYERSEALESIACLLATAVREEKSPIARSCSSKHW